MELVVRKNDLLRELQLFQGIVERKNTIPILANVLMEAKGDQVSFLATDLEVGLRSKCSASVAKGGALTLPAKKFYEIVKSLPETDIRIAEDKGGVKVAADRFDSRMQTLPREDFPTLPEGGKVPTATLSRYLGTYDTVNDGDKHFVHVTLNDATLWFDYDGKGKEPLIALSPARFSWSGSIVEFSPGAEGRMNIVIQYAEGAEPGQRRR